MAPKRVSRVDGSVVAGGILILMNENGNPGSLVASHPGNTNAIKSGVYSSRSIEPRAAEIAASLTESFEFSIVQRIAVEQVARSMAILEAIDRELDERGLVDKRGEARSLLNYRSRISGQLDRELAKIAPAIERQVGVNQTPSPENSDLVAELQRIALGQDTTATARDRIAAIRELREIKASSARDVTVGELKVPVERLDPLTRRMLGYE
jgi:hypothetical protein